MNRRGKIKWHGEENKSEEKCPRMLGMCLPHENIYIHIGAYMQYRKPKFTQSASEQRSYTLVIIKM